MRWVILSDTHGFVAPYIQSLAREADGVIHAGDIGGVDVLASITPKKGRLVAVRGNNDHPQSWVGAQELGLQDLPETASVDLPGGRIVKIGRAHV